MYYGAPAMQRIPPVDFALYVLLLAPVNLYTFSFRKINPNGVLCTTPYMHSSFVFASMTLLPPKQYYPWLNSLVILVGCYPGEEDCDC
jgi:hypothetical protein